MATVLGDLFPEEFRTDYAGRAISPKNIIVFKVDSFNADHEKFMVCITASADNTEMGCVAINTNPSPKNQHEIISAEIHRFLNYDSHMDCTSITPVSVTKLHRLITDNPERILGEISDAQHITIIQRLKNSQSIPPSVKAKFNLL